MHRGTKKGGHAGELPSNHPVIWAVFNQEILEKLLSVLTSLPLMAYPDLSMYILHSN